MSKIDEQNDFFEQSNQQYQELLRMITSGLEDSSKIQQGLQKAYLEAGITILDGHKAALQATIDSLESAEPKHAEKIQVE